MILRHFSNYLKNGGIPEYVEFEKPEYLKDLLEGILYRDIIVRYKIQDEKALREAVYYLASNIGKEFSYTNLAKTVGVSSPHTIANYCDYLEQCYLYFFICRYSHSLQKQIQSNKKCYMIDPALIRTTGFRVSEDRGRILENIVFLDLRMQMKEIYFHKEKKECDFIVREGNRIVQAIQVTTSLSDPEVKKREIEGLIEAMKTYQLQEGVILTENEQRYNRNGWISDFSDSHLEMVAISIKKARLLDPAFRIGGGETCSELFPGKDSRFSLIFCPKV